ncbi:hypothetical protein [Paenibacillus sp. NEAU-GSW1]|nr:hypothetical protein [Paenibacillus sp. NEAU-GSW1]MUT68687.1 hypothetical protein [Paenibacillus sp. NEAU-GSW1]
MITYKDQVWIPASPYAVMHWFLQMDEVQYLAWHKDHQAQWFSSDEAST